MLLCKATTSVAERESYIAASDGERHQCSVEVVWLQKSRCRAKYSRMLEVTISQAHAEAAS